MLAGLGRGDGVGPMLIGVTANGNRIEPRLAQHRLVISEGGNPLPCLALSAAASSGREE